LCTDAPCAGTADIAPVFGLSKDSIVGDIKSGNIAGAASQGWSVAKHVAGDVMPYLWCDNALNDDHIQDYYDRRPQDKTVGDGGNAEEACAPTGGDPHFFTFDLFNYTFNGIGDYYHVYHPDFKILIRMQPFNNGSVITRWGLDINEESSATLNRSVSAVVYSLEVSIDEQWNMLAVHMNGKLMLFSADMYNVKMSVGDISIQYSPFHIVIRCAFGVFAEIWMRNLNNNELLFLEFTVDVAATHRNLVSGLVGNYDENDANDLQARDGSILPDTSRMEEIHYDFGLTWLLTEADNNIFHSPFVSTVHPLNYTPLFGFDNVDPALLEVAAARCGDEFSCIFDVVATEVLDIANTTLEFVNFTKTATENIKLLYNITEVVTPAPTLMGCSLAERMNVYVLVDTNCNVTSTECFEQQAFISDLMQRIRSTDQSGDAQQLFGYIEYGNGANHVFSLHDYVDSNFDFMALASEVANIEDCNDLEGDINNPYYGLQVAASELQSIDNNHTNVVLIVSGCAPTSESLHLCSMKTFFDERDIKMFVINLDNADSYQCLVDDIDNDLINIDEYRPS